MDYLQIRDRRPLSAFKKRCIARLISLLTKDDTYTVLTIPYFENIIRTVDWSDRVRFLWLSEHPNGVYVDDDCYLKEKFVPNRNGECHFALNSVEAHPDIFLIYVNGNTDYIRTHFEYSRKLRLLQIVKADLETFYGWPVQYMRDMRNYSIIPPNVYEHGCETMQKIFKKRSK